MSEEIEVLINDLKLSFENEEYVEAENIIKIINLYLYKIPLEKRNNYKQIVKTYKSEIDKKLLFPVKTEIKNQNSLIILEQSRTQLLETEKIAIDSALKLKEQGDKIKNINNKLENISEDVRKSNSILSKMLGFLRG
jgi:hypothetical protein